MPHTVPKPAQNNRLHIAATLGVVSLMVLVISGIISYITLDRWADHAVRVQAQADDWVIALQDAQSAVRAYALSGQTGDLSPYTELLARGGAQAASARSMVADNALQSQNVETAAQAELATTRILRELVVLVGSGNRDMALRRMATNEDGRSLSQFRAAISRMRDQEERLVEARRAAASRRAIATVAAELLLMLSCAALLLVGWLRDRRHERTVRRIAVDARGHLVALADIATALAEARTRREVAAAVVEIGMPAAAADTCTLYVANEGGTILELLADRGVAADIIARIGRMTVESDSGGLFAQLRTGRAVWVENEQEYAALFPDVAGMKVEGQRAKACWSIPLRVEGHVVGLLGMGYYRARAFSSDQRAFIETYTQLCAQALQRAARWESQDEAQRWFTTTLNSIGDAVIATDSKGLVSFMNPVAEALTHWSASEATGRHLDEVFQIFSEETHAVVESPVAKVLREGKVVGLANHTLLRSKHGVEFPIDDSGAPIRSQAGELQGVVLVFRDVQHQRRERIRREFLAKAGETLISSRDYEATLSTVAQLAVPSLADWCAVDMVQFGAAYRQIAVAHIDPSKVRFARELAERYPPDPSAATGVPQVIRSGKPELYPEIPAELLEAGAQDAEHLRVIRELRLQSAMVVPLKARGRTLGAMTFVYAESGRRYTEDDLVFAEDFARRAAMAIDNAMALKEAEDAQARERVLRTEAEIASRAKDDFLATVSHELRTPLNAILGWTVLLRGRSPAPEVERGLSIIERNARAQTKLIEDVLDVSRIISGKLALTLGPTSVREAIAAAIETVTPAAAAKSIKLLTALPEPDLNLVADPDRLQQIVWNLLSNAVKFTPKGGQVTIGSRLQGSHVCIEVKDTGEGIRSDALAAIFEPFHQADASTTRRHGGLGLGLAIVKQLVVAHGGVVEAFSQGAGHGATFLVQLPARSVVPALSGPARPTTSAELVVGPVGGGMRLDGLKLLIVDDEEDARTLVSEALREQGAEVDAAASATEALERLGVFKPDILISDIGMPGMDGYSLMRKVRALNPENGGRVPAIALTAYARGEDAQRAFAAGYQRHVVKPVEVAQLALVIANLGGRTLE